MLPWGVMRATLLCGLFGLVLGCGDAPATSPLAEMAAARGDDPGLWFATPIHTTTDMQRSLDYYRDRLGYTVDWEWGQPATTFASVHRDHMQLFLCLNCDAPTGAWAMTFHREVDELHKEFKSRGAKILMPPTDMEWGLREIHVADPDGNVIRYGAPASNSEH